MSVQAQGLLSGAGGDLIAQELLRRQTNQGNGQDVFGDALRVVPQLLQAQSAGKYHNALATKALGEAKAKQIEMESRQRVASTLRDQYQQGNGGLYGDMLMGGLISGSDSMNAVQDATKVQSGYNLTRAMQSRDSSYAGGDLIGMDPNMARVIAQNAGGDPVKMQAIEKQLRDNADHGLIMQFPDEAEKLQTKFERALHDPKIISAATAAGIPEAGIPDFIMGNMLTNDEELKSNPQLHQMFQRKYVEGGLPGLQQFGYEAQKRQYELENSKAGVIKKQAETAKIQQQAELLIPAQARTEETKQVKNLRAPAPRSGGGRGGSGKPKDGTDGNLNDSQRLSLENNISKIDVAIAKEGGHTPRSKNTIQALRKQKSALQQRLGSGKVPSGQAPQNTGFLGSSFGSKMKGYFK